MPGQLSHDLPTPDYFAQAASILTAEMVVEAVPCGPGPKPIIEVDTRVIGAGIDHVSFHQIGPDQAGFCKLSTDELASALAPVSA